MSLDSVRAFFAEKAPDITFLLSIREVPDVTISTTRSPTRSDSVFAMRAGSTP